MHNITGVTMRVTSALTPSSVWIFLRFFTLLGINLSTDSRLRASPCSLSNSRQVSSSISRSSFSSVSFNFRFASAYTSRQRRTCEPSPASSSPSPDVTDISNCARLIHTCDTHTHVTRS